MDDEAAQVGSDAEMRVPYGFTIEQTLRSRAHEIFAAWTEAFDTWFALPGAIRMKAVVGEPYWFDVVHDGKRHPHYGRFTALQPDLLVEQTWLTGESGTDGAETLLRVELAAAESGTLVRLTHRGFYDEAAANRHAEAWPQILRHLDEVLIAAN
jgi:uncharacterized protein YndB with AHSA1/START domain